MLWRTSYSTTVVSTAKVLPIEDHKVAIIGSYSLEASREVEVWWRLFEEDFPGDATELLISESSLESAVGALRPPSRHSRIRFSQSVEAWQQATGNLEATRAFCALASEGQSQLIVIGPPTEEVWDQVSTIWSKIRT
jgi:hypothetical protein